MKIENILVPTDFSTCAKNALVNAIHLAEIAEARIILMSAFHVPVPHARVGSTAIVHSLASEVEENVKEDFQALEESLPQLDDINYKCVIRHGFAVDEILSAVAEYDIDLVVMGTHGASGVEEILLGSNTNSVIKRAKVPVLAIPENAGLQKTNNILLASDYREIDDYNKLDPLKMIIDLFNAELHVLHISPRDYISNESVSEAKKLENNLKGIKRSYHFETHDKFEDGLNDFMDEHPVDMIVMLPREHTLLDRILRGNHTRKIVLHSKIPLLTIHI
ncbi:MAG: universal stress protein [Cytophagales bacterium]|nr:universal stress protein [Cytophagales bacterium]